jgi:predicted PhzF superfamily epimerase YddE/YHI9
MTMTVLVVRVFTDEDGRYGNELGVVLDAGASTASSDRS